MEKEEIENIARMIRHADWYYHYSDDYGVWARGESETKKVRNYVKSKDWTKDNYEKLIEVFFKDTQDGRYGERLDAYVEDWTNRIKSLTGVTE